MTWQSDNDQVEQLREEFRVFKDETLRQINENMARQREWLNKALEQWRQFNDERHRDHRSAVQKDQNELIDQFNTVITHFQNVVNQKMQELASHIPAAANGTGWREFWVRQAVEMSNRGC